jgi:hypothetical protein
MKLPPRLYHAAALISIVSLTYLSGCSRATVSSEIKPNGDWIRTVELHGPPPDKSGGLLPQGKLEDSFAVPGPPWTVTRETKDDGLVVTCKRSMKAGETANHDVVCRAKADGKVVDVCVNSCLVKETAPGVYTYTETIHWIGPKPKDLIDAGFDKVLKSALPATVATDASVKHLSEKFSREFLLTLMGPPDPLFTSIMSQIMMNPDLAMRKLSARMGEGLDQALKDEYGDRMTAEQRHGTIKKLVDVAFKSTSDKTNVDPTKGPDKDTGSMSALTFAVKMPGKITSSNGLIDKLTNEVYWGMYPEAAAMGEDIVLTATCQANEKLAAR